MIRRHAILTFLLFLFLTAGTGAYAQKVTLEGEVVLHNSAYRTGALQPVEGALVSAPSATTEATGRKGRFRLEFAALDRGNTIAIEVEQEGLEVANPEVLQNVLVGQEAPLRIFLAEAGYVAGLEDKLLRNSQQVLDGRRRVLAAALREEGPQHRASFTEIQQQLGGGPANRFAAERLLHERGNILLRRLPVLLEPLARTNLDFASDGFRQAFEYFRQGQVEQAATALADAGLEAGAAAALATLRKWEGRGKAARAAEARQGVCQFAEAYQLQALAYSLLYRYQDALEAHLRAVALLEKTGEEEPLALAEACGLTAFNYQLLGSHEKALYYQQRDVKIKERILGGNAPRLASAYILLADIYCGMEDYTKALDAQQKGLAIRRQAPEAGAPGLAVFYAGLADIHQRLGAYSSALEAQQEAIRLLGQSLPPNHPGIGRGHHTLATIYMDEGAHLKALETQLRAIFIMERALMPGDPALAEFYSTLARIYLSLGDYPKALEVQKKVLSLQKRSLSAGHPVIGDTYHSLASTFYFLNRLDSALAYEEEAYARYQQHLLPSDERLEKAASSFAFLYTTRGERRRTAGLYDAAIADLRKALEFSPDYGEARQLIRAIEARANKGQPEEGELLAMGSRGTSRQAKAPQPASQAAAKRKPATSSYGSFRVTKATSLRERPTSSSGVLRRLAPGDKLQVLEKSERYWWKVSDNGRVGYVKALLLKKVD